MTKACLAVSLLSGSLLATTAVADAHSGAGHETVLTASHNSVPTTRSTTTETTFGPTAAAIVTTTSRPQTPDELAGPGDGGGGRPVGPADGKILTGRPALPGLGSECFVDFNDKSILNILPNHAQATFVEWPFWNQYCGYGDEGNISVQPLEYSHYHLGYEDPQIDFCADIGNFGRHSEPKPANATDGEILDWYSTPCTEIDPVAETRSSIQPHSVGAVTRIFTYESLGPHLPFSLNEIEIVSGSSELCYLPDGVIKAAGPGGSPWTCLELDPGYYDLSGFANDVIEVRVTALTPNNAIDNIGADIL